MKGLEKIKKKDIFYNEISALSIFGDDRISKQKIREIKLETLLKIVRTFSVQMDVDALLDSVAKSFFEIINVDRIGIALFNDTGEELLPEVVYRKSDELSRIENERILNKKLAVDSIEDRVAILCNSNREYKLEILEFSRRYKAQELIKGNVAYIPLLVRERPIGILYLDSLLSNRMFIEDDVRFIMRCAEYVAIAIDDSLLRYKMNRRTATLEIIHQISTLVSSTLDRKRILELIVEKVSEYISDITHSSIVLIDKNCEYGYVLSEYDQFNKKSDEPNIKIYLQKYPEIRQAIRSGKMIIIEDMFSDPIMSEVRDNLQGLNFKSVLAVPIVTDDSVIGTLFLRAKSNRGFSDEAIKLCQMVASEASSAIRKAELYHRMEELVKERTKELQLSNEALIRQTENLFFLFDLSISIARAELSSDAIANLVIDKLSRQFLCDTVSILLLNDNNAKLLVKTRYPVTENFINQIKENLILLLHVSYNKRLNPSELSLSIIDAKKTVDSSETKISDAIESNLTIPLEVGNEILGMIHLGSSKKDSFRKVSDLFFTACSQVAVAIQRVNLYEKTIKHSNELELANQQIKELNTNLEQKILDRTKELQLAYNELKLVNQELERKAKELLDTQEKLIRSEKLVAIGQLSSSIGHELRNPLSAISNSIYYIRKKISDTEIIKTDKYLSTFIEIIEKEIAESNKIITDLLDFSRVRQPVVVPTLIIDVIKDALSVIEIPEKIKLDLDIKNDSLKVLIDSNQIRQVFVNLITNAIQSISDEGWVKIIVFEDGNQVVIKISDSGTGISKDNMKKIFEPLFSTKAKGTGLGLSITKNIIEGHKGNIKIDSEVEKGTTVTITLPLQ